jgi:hypothetical protein
VITSGSGLGTPRWRSASAWAWPTVTATPEEPPVSSTGRVQGRGRVRDVFRHERSPPATAAPILAHQSACSARLNWKMPSVLKPLRAAVSALNRLEARPRSVTEPRHAARERSTVGSLVSPRCGAFPPVDGFCVGGHAVEEVGDELGMSAAASGEAELPEFCGGTVVVVDRLIRGVGAGLAGTAEKFGQLRFVAGAHAFARGAARLGWP